MDTVKREAGRARDLSKWRARVKWLGGFRTKVYVRNYEVTMDEPGDLAGSDIAPNAVEYVLTALGSCLTVGFVLNATKKGVRINDLEIAIEGDIDNILRFLGISEEGHAGYREITAKLYVRADAGEETLKELWQYTLETSPVTNSIVRPVRVKPAISVIE